MSAHKNAAKPEPSWLNKTQMADSLGISIQAFDKWGVEPVGKVGRSVYFTVRAVVDNRLAQRDRIHQPESPEEMEEGSIDYERLRLLRAQADGQEMKNEITRQEVVPVEFATFALGRVTAEAAGIMDSLPLTLVRKHPELTTVQQENIQRELAKAMNALSKLGQNLSEVLDDYLKQTAG